MAEHLTNWAGNITFGAARVRRPGTVEQLREVVAGSDRIRVLGTGHSFNRIADTTGDLVSVAGLPPTVEVDPGRRAVTVSGSVRYGELARELHAQGYALHNLASLPHISVAGSCATATHGSGQHNGNLATAVSALEFVAADGELVTLRRGQPEFAGAVVGLGALGVVTSLTLDIEPTYQVQQWVYDDLPRAALAEHWAELLGAAYSVSMFTDWTGPRLKLLWVKRRVDEATDWAARPRWHGATLADGPRHPVPGMPPVNCTEQLGVPGAWHERLPHFRLEFTPSNGAELQSEFMVPRDRAAEAFAAVYAMGDRVAAVVQVSEIRTVAADDLWLSGNYRCDSVGLHFTWVPDAAAVAPVVAEMQRRLAPLRARPHWGKVFSTDPGELAGLYERLPDFVALARRYDPTGKFRNDLLDRYLPG